MPVLQFNTQHTRRQPIRTALSRFLTSAVRGMFEISEGQRPAEVFYPYKYQRVRMIDTELEDGIVIPKGSIVSAYSFKEPTTATSPIPPPASGGVVYVGEDAISGGSWSTSIDAGYYGYSEHVAGLLILANGGGDVATSHICERYTANDVTVGTMKTDGTLAALNDNAPARAANYPIGVASSDIYQDIRGKYLNYDNFDKWGILCDWYIEVPYYDSTIHTSIYGRTSANSGYNQEATAVTDNYYAVVDTHVFLYDYHDGSVAYPIRPGAMVKSDKFGKYRTQRVAITTDLDDEYLTGQTVGRIIALDNRFPKDQTDVVDTYPGSRMPGTETGGLPAHLFNFVRDWLTNHLGSTPTISQITTAVRSGAFGVARIQLHVG